MRPNTIVLISSETTNQFTREIRAMEIEGVGCVITTSTTHYEWTKVNAGVSESSVFVPGVCIDELNDGKYAIVKNEDEPPMFDVQINGFTK